MKIIESFKNRLRSFVSPTITPVVVNTRAMAGAIFTRMENWAREIMTAKVNGEIMYGLLPTIEKARGLALNDPLIRAYLSACRKNIIGKTGFELQAQLKNDDGTLYEAFNDELEWKWYEWGKASNGDLTIDGGMGHKDFDALILNTLLINGEVFIRIHKKRKVRHPV